MRAEVATAGGPLALVDVHLSPDDGDRRRGEATSVLARLAADAGTPAFVAGDVNDEPGQGAHEVLLAAGFADAWAQRAGRRW